MESSVTVYDKRMSNLVGIGLVLGFLLPHTSTFFLLINPLLCLFYQCYKQNRIWYKNSIFILLILFVSFLMNIMQDIDQKTMYSFIAILLYVMCFPMVCNIKLSNSWIYFIAGIIVLSQFIYLLKIPFLTNLLDTYYPISERDTDLIRYTRANITWETLFQYRLGGLYRNSNQCARSLTLLFALFLINNYSKTIRKNLIFIVLVFISLLLTGSRTGFFVYGILLMVFFNSKKDIHLGIRIVMGGVLIGVFLYLLKTGSDTYRAINVSQGFSNSMNSKFITFMDYITHEKSVLRLLFGYFSPEKFKSSSIDTLEIFDADYGYLIFQYGFVGFLGFIIYFYSIFKRVDNVGKLFFVNLLWMLSSTIVTSYRAFFIFMLILSYVYSQNKSVSKRS